MDAHCTLDATICDDLCWLTKSVKLKTCKVTCWFNIRQTKWAFGAWLTTFQILIPPFCQKLSPFKSLWLRGSMLNHFLHTQIHTFELMVFPFSGFLLAIFARIKSIFCLLHPFLFNSSIKRKRNAIKTHTAAGNNLVKICHYGQVVKARQMCTLVNRLWVSCLGRKTGSPTGP